MPLQSSTTSRTLRTWHLMFEAKEGSAMTASTRSISTERLLLREITHRINNEFASAIQVVSFTAAGSSDRNVRRLTICATASTCFGRDSPTI